MKVHNSPIDLIKAYTTSAAAGVQSKGQQPSSQNRETPSLDRVDISSAVKLMQDIQRAVSQAPDVRTDKVQHIEAMIEKGIYKADLTVVAEKLLSPNISDRI